MVKGKGFAVRVPKKNGIEPSMTKLKSYIYRDHKVIECEEALAKYTTIEMVVYKTDPEVRTPSPANAVGYDKQVRVPHILGKAGAE
jgi:hypothetical protein